MHAIFTAGRRTPFGRAFKGAYHDTRPDDLLIELLSSQVADHPEWVAYGIDDLMVGCAYPEGEQGYNIGRMAALGCGLEVSAVTVNRLCASSLEVVAMAASRIEAGWGDLFLTAGIESMSRVERRGAGFSESTTITATAPHAYVSMGTTAENVARQFPQINRLEQEDLAARSHELAAAAYDRGDYAQQLHAYRIDKDEFIRAPVDRQKIASLKPVFDENGTVTAATSSPLTDGATSGWVISPAAAKQLGVQRGLEVLDCATAHVPPQLMGMGPVPAIKTLFQRNQIGPQDVAAYEINEAFAIQVLASGRELDLPMDRVNNWGGAMAIGHPLGASGLRLVMTVHDRLATADNHHALGIAALCVGGGQGMAILFRWLAG